jgi:hypothetical protein
MGMHKFYEVEMDGANKEDAAEKLKWLLILATKFTGGEIRKFAQIALKEPGKIMFLKKAAGL